MTGHGGGEMAGRKKGSLTEAMILAWADAHKACTGRWPHAAPLISCAHAI